VRAAALGLLFCCACDSQLTAGAPAWREVTAKGPSPRWGHAAGYDAKRDRMIIFGGQTAQGETAEVWSFDLHAETWTQLQTSGAPSPRVSPAVVIDRPRDRLIAFSGRSGMSSYFGETWALDLGTLKWTQLDSAPPGRERSHPVTDEAHAWFYGGESFLNTFGDLWELDLATNGWTELPMEGDGPGARTCGAIAPFNGGLLMLGGHAETVLGGAFRYSLATHRWSAAPLDGTPAAGAHWAYATDASRGTLYLAGGDHKDNYDTSLSDTLALETAAVARLPVSALPPPRDHATMIFDERRGRLVLYGGTLGDGQAYLGDLWIYPLR
jgi:hypothetical protein